MLCQDQGVFDFLDTRNMNSVSHNILEGVTSSCKTRLLSRGGQFAIADVKGLLFAQYKPGAGQAVMLTLLPESYFRGSDVSDFIEYQPHQLLVSCPGDDNFYLVNRDGGRITPIASLNQNYVTLGMQMMPGYETSFALVRDTRGIQLLDLKTHKSNQLFLSECSASFLDNRLFQCQYDPET